MTTTPTAPAAAPPAPTGAAALAALPGAEREIARVAARLPDDASCIATGSLVEGFGNANSDVDLYVIHDAGRPSQSIAIGMRALNYVDCEYMTAGSLEQLARNVADDAWASVRRRTAGEFDRYYRICIAVPVRLTQRSAQTLSAFDKATACARYAVWCAFKAHELLARGAAAAACGQETAARILVREAALWHATGVLAGQGEAYAGLKWLGEKAARRHGRGTPAFHALVDPYLRPAGTPAEQVAALRTRAHMPAGLAEALAADACRLADDVVFSGGADSAPRLVRGRRKIARTAPVATALCARLAAGEPWSGAVAALAEQLGLPQPEAAAAAWFYTADLRADGFLTEESAQ